MHVCGTRVGGPQQQVASYTHPWGIQGFVLRARSIGVPSTLAKLSSSAPYLSLQ